MTTRRRLLVSMLCAAALLSGCGREASTPSPQGGHTASNEAVRIGDVVMNISAIQTDKLPAQIVQRYGAERNARTVLIVIATRFGEDASATSVPLDKVQVVVTDLLGRKQEIAMREVRDGDSIDYVGTATVSPPDTLRFQVKASNSHGIYPAQFNRDFF
jgi:major membrane immunogen (membrane-anchored lipoprotein)